MNVENLKWLKLLEKDDVEKCGCGSNKLVCCWIRGKECDEAELIVCYSLWRFVC